MKSGKNKVLIIEDEEMDSERLIESLKEQGYSVNIVPAGEQAENALKGFDGMLIRMFRKGEAPRQGKRRGKGKLELDPAHYEIKKDGEVIALTVREFKLLSHLMADSGRIFSREELLSDVWGYKYIGDIRTVDVMIRRLREKLEDVPSRPRYIKTKRSVGYYFDTNAGR